MLFLIGFNEVKLGTKARRIRFLALFWDYMNALLLIALLVLLWNLGKGPIKVNFLKPYIEQALTNETSSYDLTVGGVNLELTHSIQPVEIIARHVVFKAKNGDYTINAPRLSLSFSARALLKGLLAPSAIAIENPSISLRNVYGLKKKKDKTENAAEEKNTAEKKVEEKFDIDKRQMNLKKMEFFFSQFEDFLTRFNSPDRLYIESFIDDIDIIDATLTVHEVETGKYFTFENMNFYFDRGLTDISIKTDSAVNFGDRTSALDMELKYRLLNDEVRYTLNFSDLVVTDLYDILMPDKQNVRAVDIPVNGQVSALFDFGNILKNKDQFAETIGENIKDVSFAIEGGEGKIGFGDSDDFDYEVSSFNLKGALHGGLDKVKIEKARFDLGGKEAMLDLSAEGFKEYILNGNLEDFKVNFTAKVGSFEMDELSFLWPRYLGEKAWEWCRDGLYGGMVSNGNFSFDFGWDKKAKSFGLLKLTGTADVADANLAYLEGMPVIHNLYGTAIFSQDKIDIKVDKGISDGVVVTGGNVLLYDLDKEDNFITINLTGNSTITDALKFIDHEPLGFTKEMGINPDEVAGDVDIVFKLDFELKTDLKPEELKVDVNGDLKQVEYLGLEEGKTFVADALKLHVTEKGFELAGVAKYQGIPLNLALKESFDEKNYKSKITAEVKVDDAVLKKLGVDSEILAAPYFTGESEVKAVLTFLNNGEVDVFVDGSLKDVEIDYAFLGFAKKKGIPCRAKAQLLIAKDKLKQVKEFSLLKAQFSAKGKMSADSKGRLSTIDITEIKAPKAFAKAKVDLAYEPKLKLKVTVSGDAYDLTEFFDSKKTLSDEEKALKKKSLKDPLEDVMDTDIVVGVNKLWTNNDVPITNFAGKAEIRYGIGLHKMNMVGNYGSSKDVKMKLDFEPRGKEYVLAIDSNNAGSTLKVLRLYENMRGGNLKIDAKRDQYRNFKGHATIRDFSLVNTPVFAKVLSLASFTGILDTLTGEGLRFTHLNAPFSYTFSTKDLATDDAKMHGPVLGVTVKGRYNMVDEEIDAKGMVIPAYGLNTFLGNIPLVGKVLAGKDGSIFGTNYSISGYLDKPKVSINPLSTLAPNSIKELFSSEE